MFPVLSLGTVVFYILDIRHKYALSKYLCCPSSSSTPSLPHMISGFFTYRLYPGSVVFQLFIEISNIYTPMQPPPFPTTHPTYYTPTDSLPLHDLCSFCLKSLPWPSSISALHLDLKHLYTHATTTFPHHTPHIQYTRR